MGRTVGLTFPVKNTKPAENQNGGADRADGRKDEKPAENQNGGKKAGIK